MNHSQKPNSSNNDEVPILTGTTTNAATTTTSHRVNPTATTTTTTTTAAAAAVSPTLGDSSNTTPPDGLPHSNSMNLLGHSMQQAESELQSLHRTFHHGSLNAFSSSEPMILSKIDQISQIQVRSFMNAIEIEKKWQNVVPEKGDREGVKKAFYEKEKAVTGLVRRLQGISKHIDQINKEIRE